MSQVEPGDELEEGQIWLARPDHGPDLCVLIVEVHGNHVQALLCDDDCWRATDTDAVLEPETTGCGRRLLVHGDLAAQILTRRLWRMVGQVEVGLTRRIALRGRGFDFNSNDLGRGPAILSDSDPRWAHKQEKLRELRGVRARARELGWEICGITERDPEPAA
jgi:hypothetical protein